MSLIDKIKTRVRYSRAARKNIRKKATAEYYRALEKQRLKTARDKASKGGFIKSAGESIAKSIKQAPKARGGVRAGGLLSNAASNNRASLGGGVPPVSGRMDYPDFWGGGKKSSSSGKTVTIKIK